MALYLATLGGDPAPVALGYVVACAMAGQAPAAVLVPEYRGAVRGLRGRRLARWLEGHAGRPPLELEPPGDFEAARKAVAGALREGEGPLFVNFTGGAKPTSLAAAEAGEAAGATVFAVNPHAVGGLRLHFLAAPGRPGLLGSQAAGADLELEDFLAIYLDLERGEPLGAAQLGACDLRVDEAADFEPLRRTLPDDHAVVELDGKRYAVLVRGNRLYVAQVQRREATREMQEHRSHAFMLGGSLAVPVFRAEPEPVDGRGGRAWAEHRRRVADKRARAQQLGGAFLEPGEGFEAALREPAAPPADAPALVSLVGDQPGPTLASYCAMEPRPGRVYLLTSPQKAAVVGRLARVLADRGATVERVTDLDAADPATARRAVALVLGRCRGRRVVVNLNGGTTLMAAEAYRATAEAPPGVEVEVEYVARNRPLGLRPAGARPAGGPIDLSLDEVAAVHGVRLEDRTGLRLEPDGAVYEAALACLAAGSGEAGRAAWSGFKRAWTDRFGKRVDWEASRGLPLEYATFHELAGALAGAGADVRMDVSLVHRRWNAETDADEDLAARGDDGGPGARVHNQADVLAVCRGELLLVETKPTLAEALGGGDREHAAQSVLAQAVGGHFGRAMVVGRCPVRPAGGAAREAYERNLKAAVERGGRDDLDLLTLWAREGAEGEVRPYPGGLPGTLARWGWR